MFSTKVKIRLTFFFFLVSKVYGHILYNILLLIDGSCCLSVRKAITPNNSPLFQLTYLFLFPECGQEPDSVYVIFKKMLSVMNGKLMKDACCNMRYKSNLSILSLSSLISFSDFSRVNSFLRMKTLGKY